MKRLQILRVDNDLVQKVDLQIGNNVIGRSVIIGCDDERVIKQAVTINVTRDNEMTITPYQVSPCYMKSTESSQWKLLKLGISVPIKPGYICSLVPDKCCFKIISVSDKMENNEEYTLKRKANEDVDSRVPDKKLCAGDGDSSRSSSDMLIKMLNDKNDIVKVNIKEDNTQEDNSLSNAIDNKTNDSMYKVVCEPQRIEESCIVNKDVLKIKNPIQISSKPLVDMEASNVETNSNLPPLSKNDKNRTEDAQPAISAKTQKVDVSTNSNANFRREKCRYAEKCYRRSSKHKAKFSHPEDSDYDIPDDRENCPYGEHCYRKNAQHKMRYKHISKNIANERNKRNRKQTQIQRPLDTFSRMDDSSAEESVEESIDESEYDPSSDVESSDDDETYSEKNESDWED